jgi:PleD family two-component response regulator
MQTKEEIIRQADDALLQAKRKGKNRIEVNA